MFQNKMYRQILEFIKEPTPDYYGKNRHFSNNVFDTVYLRNTKLFLPDFSDDWIEGIVVASISVKPKYLYQGHGSRLLDYIHKNNQKEVTKIENVCNDLVGNWGLKRGFIFYSPTGDYSKHLLKFNTLVESPVRYVVRVFNAVYGKEACTEFGLGKMNHSYCYKVDEVQTFEGDTYYRVYSLNDRDVLEILTSGIFHKFFYEV